MAGPALNVYRNPLAAPADLDGWTAEGPVAIEHSDGGTVLSSAADEAALIAAGRGDRAHFTLWCPEEFGPDIAISWDFRPLSGDGLAMLFFAATGTAGRDLFDPALAPRTGRYPQYHSGDVSALHVSYLRRKWPDERRFHTCNLRKSPGFHLVAQGADPLPGPEDADRHYRVSVVKRGREVSFAIDGLRLFTFHDPEPLGEGRIGLRQMSPLVALYRNLEVTALP
ncbi:DUF1961 family protein [Glycomyces harbinensis]|uniref:DUF1961 family protein n=1 Tax=Glycomyces harbinensis TaxID=58114 RepID=A0A1G7AP49_9ACTN|nr:DUF1961 family protein [Glycomyces harbinensis]SDE16562.1 protein of unknown function [Glycomyces harbinensis]